MLKQLVIVLAPGTLYDPKINPNVRVAIVPFARHLVHAEQPEIYTKIVEVFME